VPIIHILLSGTQYQLLSQLLVIVAADTTFVFTNELVRQGCLLCKCKLIEVILYVAAFECFIGLNCVTSNYTCFLNCNMNRFEVVASQFAPA